MTPGPPPDPRRFYDAYVEEHVPYHRSPRGLKAAILAWLPYWSYREWRFWRRWVPRAGRLLDLGCARGREIFRDRAERAAGVDLARPALRECAAHYDLALEGSLDRLPFASESFDCVVSSHVLGHIPPEAKPAVIAEIARVLRPGGLTLHVIETEGTNPLIVRAKQQPELYARRLLAPDGHWGLEAPRAALARFESAGFERLEALAWETDAIHPRLAVKWFENEYADEPAFAALVRRARRILASPAWLALEEIRLGRRGRSERPLERALFVAAAFKKGLVSSKK